MKITITKPELLAAAALCTSTEETRYYLRGIHISVAPNTDGVTIAATDGHRLFVGHDPDATSDLDPKGNGVILATKPALPTGWRKAYSAQLDGETIRYTDGADPVRTIGIADMAEIDGTFPDWARVVPTETNGDTAQFDAKYLGDAAKMGKMLTQSTILNIAHNGLNPARITFGQRDDALLTLMPVRPGDQPHIGHFPGSVS